MNILADFHLHTIASGHGFSTIAEYIQAAKAAQLSAIAFTDHGPAMPGGAHYYHFCNLKALPRTWEGILLLRGIEANIVDDQGKLDVPDEDLANLDIVLAAFHSRCGYADGNLEQNTRVLKKAMENPHVTVIAHPGNIYYPVDIKEIVGFAKETGVLIEINQATLTGWARRGSSTRCLEFAREIKRQNWYVCLGSDSHFIDTVGQLSVAVELVEAAGIPADHVVNTSRDLIEEWFIKSSDVRLG
ncbi:MAG: phosphatase [Candidatus Margulisiibacteriota bacterium]